ncbi:MAG: penicillin-binding protein, partial [Candidatus Colwellbacteria bacterium]|nr:penicillin-binding protein [Candidatus Colwellbacteria bacterium]
MRLPRLRVLLILCALGFLAAGIFLIFFVAYLARALPPVVRIQDDLITESTKIFDRTGSVLLYEIHGEERRTVISADEIPDVVKRATIAIEDDGFYDHPAFDLKAIVRALAANILRGRIAQGGSTITQQLAKNAFLTPERSLTRKLKELILAYRIERLYSKDEILTLYLNHIPYGKNSYGIEAASLTYFGKPARDLSLSEAALLAALPKAPSYYSPWGSHRGELEERRIHVLKRLLALGFIDEAEFLYAVEHSPKVGEEPRTSSFALAPHFI